MIIAWDCDGTLLNFNDTPRWDLIDLLRCFARFRKEGNTIIVWSGGGKEWAEQVVKRLNLQEFVDKICDKEEAERLRVDICFDDEIVDLAQMNIKV